MTERPDAEEGKLLEDLRVFHEVARALTSTLDRDTVLRAIMTQMARFFSPQSWSLLLVDEPRQELYFAVVEGRFDHEQNGKQLDEQTASARLPLGQGMAGWVAAHGEPLIVPDVRAALSNGMDSGDAAAIRLSPAEQRAISFDVQSVISLPLQSRGRTLLTDYAAIAIENARAVERIQELTITDDCTRLFNTRHLHAALQTEFERARRFQTEFSVIFIDLDHFKQVNDLHGHLIGTEMLVEVAQLIQGGTRSVDAVFRYGGDEFVVLLPQTGKAAAVDAAHRLRQALKGARFLSSAANGHSGPRDLQLTMTASFGVATYPLDGETPESILQIADGRMYSIKHTIRDGIAFS
jgi:diguanylate cyclase (GGDEF)-like protein